MKKISTKEKTPQRLILGVEWKNSRKLRQVRFECGLEVRELILRKVKDPTMDIENKNLQNGNK